MILHARDTRQVAGVRILPIGLIFERKDRPRSRIVAVVDEPIDVDPIAQGNPNDVADITAAIDGALRRITLNYATLENADRDARMARALHALLRFEAPSIGSSGDFAGRAEIARLLPALRRMLIDEHATMRPRARAFETDLLAFDARLKDARVSLDDFSISRGLGAGTLFVLREALVLAVAGPVALWGWMNHVIPFRAALLAGGRVRHSAADPAMRTIVAGAAFVLMMYMLQGAAVTLIAGPWWGLAYIVSLPVAADINLRMRDRLYRALRRARTYLAFRAQPTLHDELIDRARSLRSEAVALAHASGFAVG